MTLRGVREHQAAFQEIADDNGGNRFSGLPGHDASVEYVVDALDNAGYRPEVQEFDYLAFTELGASALQQTAPGQVTYVQGVDFGVIDQSDGGDVTAPVTAVDLQLGLGNTTTSGCEPADFAGFPAGNIALLQRGACTFEIKAENAAAAGAVGIVIFNQGETADPGRQGIPAVTLTANNTSGIPVLGTTYALGEQLAGISGLQMRVFANAQREIKTTFNVLAETRRGDDSNVVMVGGHLDSVFAGPGINDNGSGSAAILEVAEQMRKVRPNNTVRFAWWGAEESGLVGSDFYVASLTEEERANIALYLNFDMVGSPNYVRFVYDGDGSAFGLGGPARFRCHRGAVRGLLRRSRAGVRAHPDRLPLRLRRLLRQRHPVRRPVHRRRGHQDTGAGGRLRRHRGPAVRPLLPHGLRHLRQRQQRGARPQQRRHRPRDADLRDEHRHGDRRDRRLESPVGGDGCRRGHERPPAPARRRVGVFPLG